MILENILSHERTICRLESTSKKRTFEFIADFLSNIANEDEINPEQLIELLNKRERLGSTGIGKGIAIPHCRCKDLTQPLGLLITLGEPVNFDSPDEQKVDIIFVLIVPDGNDEQHLNVLSSLAELFYLTEFRNQIRKAETNEELYYAVRNFERVKHGN